MAKLWQKKKKTKFFETRKLNYLLLLILNQNVINIEASTKNG